MFFIPDFDLHIILRSPGDFIGNHLFFRFDLIVSAPHKPLDRKDRILWVRYSLSFGDLPDKPLTIGRKRDDGGGRSVTFAVGNHDRIATFHYRDARVRRAEVDPDHF